MELRSNSKMDPWGELKKFSKRSSVQSSDHVTSQDVEWYDNLTIFKMIVTSNENHEQTPLGFPCDTTRRRDCSDR